MRKDEDQLNDYDHEEDGGSPCDACSPWNECDNCPHNISLTKERSKT
jgi:hypothetical protein